MVSCHAKNPTYYDEFKIRLPPLLTPKHHLLFTLYHLPLHIGKTKDLATEVGTPVSSKLILIMATKRTNNNAISAKSSAMHGFRFWSKVA